MPGIFSRSQQLTKLDSALDKIIAVIILCLGIVFMTVSLIENRPNGISLSVVALVSSLVYLVLRKRLSIGARLFEPRSGNRVRSLSHIIFIISLSLSIWLLWNNLYYRPPVYFGLCLLAAASIIWDIFISDETRDARTAIVLFKIITLSLTIYAGIYYQFPGIYGIDPWWHHQWIQETVSLGYITPGQFNDNQYFLFPVFHLAAATMHIITGLSLYSSVFAAVSVLIAVSSIFIFLIGKRLANVRVGLLAAFIFPLTDVNIYKATAIIPMSLGFCFFAAILYLIFYRDRKRVSDSLLIILLSVTLIFTHTIATFIMLLSLITVFIGTKLHKQISGPVVSYESVSLTLILFFGATMLFRWMQTPWSGEAFFDPHFRFLVDSLQYSAEFAPMQPLTAESNLSYAVSHLNKGGYLLLLCFAIIGTLIHLHYKKRTALIMALAFTAAVLLILPTGFDLFGLTAILPPRWFPFLYLPLSILAVQGILGISSLIKWTVGKIGMVMLVILAAIFMMTTNTLANGDSPLVFNGAMRLGYTQSEITAITTLADIGCGPPMTDRYYGRAFSYVLGYDKFRDIVQRGNKVFVLRNYYLHHPEWNKNYTAILEPLVIKAAPSPAAGEVVVWNYLNKQEIDSQHLIYINQNVKAYDISGLGMEP